MSAFSNKKKQDGSEGLVSPKSPATQILSETPEEILQRKRNVRALHESRVGDSSSLGDEPEQPKGLAAEKPVGALCFLPKSLHRLASRAAEDRDITGKRFFLECILIGLEQQGVISPEQHADALALPAEYGWKGRSSSGSSSSSSSD
jgi:hypothetical protein